MAKYVDGFLIPVPTDKLEAYRKIAEAAGVIWKDHSALGYQSPAAFHTAWLNQQKLAA